VLFFEKHSGLFFYPETVVIAFSGASNIGIQ
jgi:hypothetical protein